MAGMSLLPYCTLGKGAFNNLVIMIKHSFKRETSTAYLCSTIFDLYRTDELITIRTQWTLLSMLGWSDLRVQEEVTVRRLCISSRTSYLLHVALETLGHVVVDDASHVGLVQAHPKGHGGHHHPQLAAHEVILDPPPL